MSSTITSIWTQRARRAAEVTGLVTGGTMLSVLGLAYFVARVLTGPRRPGPMDEYVMTPFETGAEFEEVAFASETGDHSLQGWWFPRPDTTQVIIGCTGYRGSKAELVGIGSALWRAGFNVLLFDYYGHGADRGAPVTLAYREVRDFYGALDYVEQRVPGAQIGVIGYSMGAAVAIMGSARRQNVRAIVADSAFATHLDVVSHNVTKVIRISGRPIAALSDVFLERIAGYRGADVAPEKDVAAIAPRPILIIHGTRDDMIPLSHAWRIFAAAGEPKELWIAEGAGHCGAYFLDRRAYCDRVITFFQRAFGQGIADTETDLGRAGQPPSEHSA